MRLENVTGLSQGNPVRMSGVTIGTIRDIKLPKDPKQKQVEILLMIDRNYAERVRGDSRARLKKLGLLTGDSYIDVSPGTPRFPALEPGSMIPAQNRHRRRGTHHLGRGLGREPGADFLLPQEHPRARRPRRRPHRRDDHSPETKQRITDTLLTTLNKTNAALTHMESGKGVAGKLIYDDKYAEELTASISAAAKSMQTLTASIQTSFEKGDGMVPALLNDPEGKRRVYEVVDNLKTTSANLATFTATLQTGEGLVPRLLNDKAYGDQALNEFTGLVRQLNEVVSKINNGDGTAGKLISDPSMYESINDILIGINESELLAGSSAAASSPASRSGCRSRRRCRARPAATSGSPVDANPVRPEDVLRAAGGDDGYDGDVKRILSPES